jgi:hypothetical protein
MAGKPLIFPRSGHSVPMALQAAPRIFRMALLFHVKHRRDAHLFEVYELPIF